MGKKIVPPQDSSRIQVVLNDKKRTMGVNLKELEQQVEERRQLMLNAQRARLEEDEEWSSHWNYIESMFEKHETCQRKRRLDYGKALKEQMDAMKRQKKLDTGFFKKETEDSFMDRFGTSHR